MRRAYRKNSMKEKSEVHVHFRSLKIIMTYNVENATANSIVSDYLHRQLP